MKYRNLILAIVLLFTGNVLIRAQLQGSTLNKGYDFSSVDSQIQAWIDKGYYPGVSVLIAKDNKIIYEKYFGNYTPETEVYIASAGKWIGAATMAVMADEGKISWDDPVSKWLPEFTDIKGLATIRQLYSHTSGYPNYQPQGNPKDDYQTTSESVEHILPLIPTADPGAIFDYGGLAMQVAGRIAELAEGTDWETLFQEKLAIPLNMINTHFIPVDPGHTPMIAGGARSTLHDYANFLSMIINNGVFKGKRVLSKKAIHEMQADQVRGAKIKPGVEFAERARGSKHNGIYGLGEWREIVNKKGEAVLISSPSWAGTYPWIDKKRNIYGIILTHVGGPNARRDNFDSFYASPSIYPMVCEAIDRNTHSSRHK
jgi:CubicO group peptidase (beta-lactamase class C family)